MNEEIKAGTTLLAEERYRQLSEHNGEGWTKEHDDLHVNCELSRAAATYLRAYHEFNTPNPDMTFVGSWYWPWDLSSWKPSDDPVRNLVKAGALIAAEIDRLQRIK